MRINIAASHRFHLLDLARELEKLGHEVRFYSYVPTKRAIKFGLKKENSYSLFYFMLPFLALVKLTKSSFLSIKLKHLALDYYLALFMKPCDVYIALGTVYKKSFVSAKKKYGAITILEWGSKHIEEQQRILSQIPEVKKQPEYFTKRSLDGYEIADYIAIASDHVRKSFIERGIAENKLIQNPYGVDLSMFKSTELIEDNIFDLIVVGAWSYQKGCDLLIEVCRKNNYRLLHVGTLVDVLFPTESNMTHINSVDQSFLINYYAQARVFVLPSRQDGLAMVQVQALACGLPIVCSKNTGGRDLRKFLDDNKWIIEMQDYTVNELSNCIYQALELSKTQLGVRSYSDNVVEQLTWGAYGKRYNENIMTLKLMGKRFDNTIKISDLLIRIAKKGFRIITQKKFDAPACDCNRQSANDKIYHLLLDDKPCMISRFGTVEINCVNNYLCVKSSKSELFKILNYISDKTHTPWWNVAHFRSMSLNAGIFPIGVETAKKFSERYLEDIPEIDLLGCHQYYEKFMPLKSEIIKVQLEMLYPFFVERPWTRILKGKKVLVIHPFDVTIKHQYDKRNLLFDNQDILPEFELITYKAIQSIAGNIVPFISWFDALDLMEKDIDVIDFDIAIIGCGAYGLPLAAHVKRMGKKAIHLAGGTQLLFGIKGKRWVEQYSDELNYKPGLNININYRPLFNDNWIFPFKCDTPENSNKVENGCYW